MVAAEYLDVRTGERYPIDRPRWRSDSGNVLSITPLSGISRDEICRKVRSIWRYAAALPVPVTLPITLGEGCTPLVEGDIGGAGLLLKLEWFSPTGSFKDRGASVMLSILRQQGIRSVIEDSSGNGGCAIAAYAAAGGLEAEILVPTLVQPNKVIQTRAYGAKVELIAGDREACAREAIRRAESVFYASHNWQPFFLQGSKTLAYELWEDLGFRAPDNIIFPTGAGSGLLGCDIGFGELLRRGEIERLPRLFAAQPANCAPIHQSLSKNLLDVEAATAPRPTVAEGTSISRPVRGAEVLAAIRRSAGTSVQVDEGEIAAAAHELARQGHFVEPTSAVAAAGAAKLIEQGLIAAGQTTVVILTGTGLKAAAAWSQLLACEERASDQG